MNHNSRILYSLLAILMISCTSDKNRIWDLEDIRIRDPFILADTSSGYYYMYAQMANRLGDNLTTKGVEVYRSRDLEHWEGPDSVFTIPSGFWADLMVWAPEVHEFNGKFYLLVTFTASDTLPAIPGRPRLLKRGTQILMASSPTGPFQPFRNRSHTPTNWMSLDGTFWVEDGIPWMVFCHEWLQITNGTVELVQLKPDLSDLDGSPITLFLATEAPWVKSLKEANVTNQNDLYDGFVTDGPFLYKTTRGKLLMIWSSFGEDKYAVGIAESESGKIIGPWHQQEKPLFKADGGHGMIFKTFDGRLMLALHQPNTHTKERAKFFELVDTGETLILK